MRRFFTAAAKLWKMAPWKNVYDSQLLRLDCPALDARDKVVSIIGNLGESFGVLVFDPDRLLRPLTDRDVVFATACAEAITEFFARHGNDIADGTFKRASERTRDRRVVCAGPAERRSR